MCRRWWLMGVATVLVSGCGLLRQLGFPIFLPNGGNETGSAKLVPFESERDFLDYFTGQVQAQSSRGGNLGFPTIDEIVLGVPSSDFAADGNGSAGGGDLLENAAPPLAPGGSERADDAVFSDTTIQEVGVDEADVVKTDGNNLYLMSDEKLRIVQLQPADAIALLAEVPLTGYGRDLYLRDGKVVALTGTYGEFATADGTESNDVIGGASAPVFSRPQTIVTVIDVSSPSQPAVLSETRFEGSVSSSRMIDGTLYLVVANFQSYFYDDLPFLGRIGFAVPQITSEQVLPRFERVADGDAQSSGDVLDWQDLYRPADPDGFGIVTVISLDVDNNAAFTAKGVVAEPGLIYSSLDALYLTDTNYNFFGDTRDTTDIYKFAYNNGAAEPVATGSVPGRILNQYSMGEYNGYLRVASTVGPTFSVEGLTSESTNAVYVLGQTDGELTIVGSVDNIAPRETIQSARFLGDRGYVVTFEQIDPLFTLDLADPTNPRVVGELKVPGFSTFLVPVDDDHLLAVGQYVPPPGEFAPWAVQLSLFDVSNFASPTLMDNVIIGKDNGAYSEALYDPKAFTYFPESNLIAFPVSMNFGEVVGIDPFPIEGDPIDGGVSSGSGSADEGTSTGPIEPVSPPETDGSDVPPVDEIEPISVQSFEGLMVYSLSTTDGFTEMGRISTQFGEMPYSSYTRGVFIDQNVFAVTDNGLRGGSATDPSTVLFELSLPRQFNDFLFSEPEPLDSLVER